MTGVMFLYALVRKSEKKALLLLFTYLVLVGFFHNSYYLPAKDKAFKSPRLITDNVKGFTNGKDVFLYGDNSAGLMFYIGKPVRVLLTAEDIRKYAKIDSVLIIPEHDAKSVDSELNMFYRPIKTVTMRKKPISCM